MSDYTVLGRPSPNEVPLSESRYVISHKCMYLSYRMLIECIQLEQVPKGSESSTRVVPDGRSGRQTYDDDVISTRLLKKKVDPSKTLVLLNNPDNPGPWCATLRHHQTVLVRWLEYRVSYTTFVVTCRPFLDAQRTPCNLGVFLAACQR